MLRISSMTETTQHSNKTAIVIGASGGIGRELVLRLLQNPEFGKVFALSRTPFSSPVDDPRLVTAPIDLLSDQSISDIKEVVGDERLDLVIVATGLLHGEDLAPEKSLKQLRSDASHQLFQVNAVAPMLVAQQVIGNMPNSSRSVFAVLSARVSSISDNRLGGWYSYRASKAALNMFLKTLAVETQRRQPGLIVAGLHPGTVSTALSKPFLSRVPDKGVFSPALAAEQLLAVIEKLGPEQSGKLFAWDGQEIEP